MSKSSVLGSLLIAVLGATSTGCAGALVQPGHRALLFDPSNGGIQHEVLQPGWYRLACPFWTPETKCPRVDDFDVTYSTSKEAIHALSKEGLPLDLHIAVAYRPIVSELYLLDTEIGPNYFDEVIGPEFRSAAIGVFAHTSYQDLQRKNGRSRMRSRRSCADRLQGKHIEVSSVLIEKVTYDPKILEVAARARRLARGDARQEAARSRTTRPRRSGADRAPDRRDRDARRAQEDRARRADRAEEARAPGPSASSRSSKR